MLCLHCQDREVNRSRGLCWSCFYRPGIRELYGSSSVYATRGLGANNTGDKQPPEPTDALPGTLNKMRVMSQRIADGYAPFHPLDPTWHGTDDEIELERTTEPAMRRMVQLMRRTL